MKNSLTRRLVVGLVLTVLAAPALVGCGGGDDADRSPQAEPEPTALTPEFSVHAPGGFGTAGTLPNVGEVSAVVLDDQLVTASRSRLIGYGLDDGHRAWSFTKPRTVRSICTVSPSESRHTLGLLMTAAGTRQSCTVVAALDTRTGQLRWQTTLHGSIYFEGQQVDVGRRTVVATMECEAVYRFDLRTGRRLRTIAPIDRKCSNETTTDGRLVFVASDPVTSRTPPGTGIIPAVYQPGALELWNADTGRLLWRDRIDDSRGSSADAIVSTDPLVLTATVDGHQTTGVYDSRGRRTHYLGLGYDETQGSDPDLVPVGRIGDTLVAEYHGTTTGLYGYDVRTGRQQWHRELYDAAAAYGTTASGVVLSDAHDGGYRLVLAAPTSADDPNDTRGLQTLGEVADAPTVVTSTHVVTLSLDEDRIQVYRLPSAGEPGLVGGESSAGFDTPADGWADDDVRTIDPVATCAAVTPATLARVGIRLDGRPRTEDCSYRDASTPEYVDRELQIATDLVEPTRRLPRGSSDPVTVPTRVGVRDAEDRAAKRARTVAAPVTEAHSYLRSGGLTLDLHGTTVTLTTIWRNVVVTVSAEGSWDLKRLRDRAPTPHRMVAAARVATRQVLTSLGAAAS